MARIRTIPSLSSLLRQEEPPPSSEVQQARRQQTLVLQQRQLRELRGHTNDAYRDSQNGADGYPPLATY